MTFCTEPGCTRKHKALGLCTEHYKRNWWQANTEKHRLYNAAQRSRYPERHAAANKRWFALNKGKATAYAMRRYAAIRNRTPAWLDEDDLWLMSQAYELAALRTKMLGFSWHVDHVIPLHGELVSGFHVPANLRVIPGAENCSKGNSFFVS